MRNLGSCPPWRILPWIIVILALSTAAFPAEDDTPEETPAKRPTIGLVLGGGGARGAAHIGVLEVLRDMNIPIDYVAGTSMGSIVGALFSVGMQPDEIQASVVGVNWFDLFNDFPTRTQRTFRRKEDDSSDFLPVEWGWKDHLVLSAGVVSGQKLSFAFRDPALYLSGHHGFDKLSYPFRPVTTNLQTGEMFVPERGNLLKAVRASMSIPGVFPPVRWDGMLLADGYLSRNLPVDVCRAMGADIIIAVDVGEHPAQTTMADLNTMMEIRKQVTIIGSRQNVDPQLALADIVIQPDLTGISSADFPRVAETIEPGRRAALAVADQLRALSVSDEEYAAHLYRHQPMIIPPLVIDEIILENHSRVDDRAILEWIHQQIGAPLDLDVLKKDLAKIYDFGVFELVDFELELRNRKMVLIINTHEKYYAPNIINFGLSYEGGEGGKSDVELRLRWTKLEMNKFGGELRTDAQLGTDNLLNCELYQPLNYMRRPFASLTGHIEQNYYDYYVDLEPIAQYKTFQTGITPALGYRLGHFGEIQAGVNIGYLSLTDHTGVDPEKFEGPRGGYISTFAFDMFDQAVLPQRGFGGLVQYFQGEPKFGSDLDYARLHGGIASAHTFGRQTIRASVEGGSSFDSDMPIFDQFTLGGLSHLSGYHQGQLRGDAYGLAKVAWYHRLHGYPSPFTSAVYFLLQGEVGNTWEDPSEARWDNLRFSGLVSLVTTTIVGPVSIAYGQGESGHHSFYVTIGTIRPFLK